MRVVRGGGVVNLDDYQIRRMTLFIVGSAVDALRAGTISETEAFKEIEDAMRIAREKAHDGLVERAVIAMGRGRGG
jgi:hypothetical protein